MKRIKIHPKLRSPRFLFPAFFTLLILWLLCGFPGSPFSPFLVAKIPADVFSPKARINNSEFIIDDARYPLVKGEFHNDLITVKTVGDPFFGDFNSDSKTDAATFISVEAGGSGTFYYGAALLSHDGGYSATPAVFLGDRIAPQSISYKEDEFIFRYSARADDEPMAVKPHLGKSALIHIDKEGKLTLTRVF